MQRKSVPLHEEQIEILCFGSMPHMKLKPGDQPLLTDSLTAGLVYFAVQRGFVALGWSSDLSGFVSATMFRDEALHSPYSVERLSSRANFLFPKSIICWGIELWLEPLNCSTTCAKFFFEVRIIFSLVVWGD